MSIFSKILIPIKEWLLLNSVYQKRYPSCSILSIIPKNVKIGRGVTLKQHVMLSAALSKVGNNTYIGDGCEVINCSSIGNFCSLSHGVKIGLDNHLLGTVSTSPLFYSPARKWYTGSYTPPQPTVIEHDVLISANALILSGVKIGTGAVIGAGAFVNKDVPPYAIVAGMPAKIIRYRFEEQTITMLLASKWWELPDEQLKKLNHLFDKPSEFCEQVAKVRQSQ